MADEQQTTATLPVVGAPAPDFDLPSGDGTPVRLKDLRGKQVVLYFYPKDDTPGCTTEACSFRDSWQDLQKQGVVVLGVSKDSVADHQQFAQKYGLPFPLLSDEHGDVSERYGVWGEQNWRGQTYTGMARTTFYIRPDGTIGHVWERVKPAGHSDEVLAVVGADK